MKDRINDLLVGRMVLVRSRDAGVHIGRLVAFGCEGGVSLVLLAESRILWRWAADDDDAQLSFTTHGIAINGIPEGSRLTDVDEEIELVEYSCSIIPLSERAVATL